MNFDLLHVDQYLNNNVLYGMVLYLCVIFDRTIEVNNNGRNNPGSFFNWLIIRFFMAWMKIVILYLKIFSGHYLIIYAIC